MQSGGPWNSVGVWEVGMCVEIFVNSGGIERTGNGNGNGNRGGGRGDARRNF